MKTRIFQLRYSKVYGVGISYTRCRMQFPSH